MVINEQQIIKNKILDDNVLYFAMALGLLSGDNFSILKSIGRCKQVGQLMSDLLITELASVAEPLMKLYNMRLIEIDSL